MTTAATETAKPTRPRIATNAPIGKFLKKLRIDHDEVSTDMAERLSVSPVLLSDVETGKREAPAGWVSLIAEHYALSETALEELRRVAAPSSYTIKLAPGATAIQRTAAEALAQRFARIDDSGALSLLELLDDIAPDTPEVTPA